MRYFRQLPCKCWAVVVAALLFGAGRAAADPVDDLRQALDQIRVQDMRKPSEEALKFRRESLEEKSKALKSFSDLRRALALDNWLIPTAVEKKKAFPEDIDPIHRDLQDIDYKARTKIGQRLIAAIEAVANEEVTAENARRNANSRLAVANLIAEMGPKIRSLDRNDRGGFARSLAPIVAKIASEARDHPLKRSLPVRQEALRAMGSINAEAKYAEEVLADALSSKEGEAFGGAAIGPQRVAADALAQMIRVVTYIYRQQQQEAQTDVKVTPDEVVSLAEKVVRASRPGFDNPDGQVRALCVIVVKEATTALSTSNLIEPPHPASDFPPVGRPLSKDEQKDLEDKYAVLIREFDRFASLLDALNEQGPRLRTAVDRAQARLAEAARQRDPNLAAIVSQEEQVKLEAVETLELAAYLRLRLARRFYSVPMKGKEAEFNRYDPVKKLLEADKNLGTALVLLSDTDVRIRRKTIEFLESLQQDGAPAIPGLIGRLGDSDRFVRWAAARALGHIDPAQAAAAISPLAQMLTDSDGNVRKTAAETLKIFASAEPLRKSLAAVGPTLTHAVHFGDTDARVRVIDMALALGVENARSIVPGLVDILKDADANSKLLLAAAGAFDKWGTAAFEGPTAEQRNQPLLDTAIAALRRLLGHEDAEVRTMASDALLTLTQGNIR